MLLNNASNFSLERKAHVMAASGCCRERALLLITSGIALLALASMRREGSLAVLVTARRKVTKCLTRISLREKKISIYLSIMVKHSITVIYTSPWGGPLPW